MGLEAISRGASFVLSIEGDKRQCREIQDHFRAFNLSPNEAKAVPVDVNTLLAKPCKEEPFDIVFIDPPYGFETLAQLPDLCIQNGWVRPNGILIVEHGIRDADIPNFSRRDYGDSSISVLVLDSERLTANE
jgi:16S rRNA (guanine966-N2)-methyltransferase